MAMKPSTASLAKVRELAAAPRGNANATTNPMPAVSRPRRPRWVISASRRRTQHRGDYPNMRAAATKVGGEFVAHLLLAGFRGARQQCGRGHDHAVAAIAALRRL